MIKELEKYHEIKEIIESITEIDNELNSTFHDIEKLRTIHKKAKSKFFLETSAYEKGVMLKTNNTVSIDDAPLELLLDRLPLYKILYEQKLSNLNKR